MDTNLFEGFTEWEKGSTRIHELPVFATTGIFVNHKGYIIIPNPTLRIMEDPASVLVYVDKVRSKIAFRKCTPDSANSYHLRKGKLFGVLSCSKLAGKFNLMPVKGLRYYTVVVNDRTIILDFHQNPTITDWKRV